MQLMSIIDTSVQITKQIYTFAKGRVGSFSSLCGTLIDYSVEQGVRVRKATRDLYSILGILKLCNPIVQNYATVLEQENPDNGVRVLTGNDTRNIVEREANRDPRSHESTRPKGLGLAFFMPSGASMLPDRTRASSSRLAAQENVGTVQRRTVVPSATANPLGTCANVLPFPLCFVYKPLVPLAGESVNETHADAASAYAPDAIPQNLRSAFQTQNVANITLSVPVPPVQAPVPNSSGASITRNGPLAVDPNRLDKIDVSASHLEPEAPLPYLQSALKQCLNLEMCLFPFLFPYGTVSNRVFNSS